MPALAQGVAHARARASSVEKEVRSLIIISSITTTSLSAPPPPANSSHITQRQPAARLKATASLRAAALCTMTTMAADSQQRKRKFAEDWEPKQVELKPAMDLRYASLGPRGYKLKPIKSGLATLNKVQAAAAAEAAAADSMDTEEQQQQQQQQEPEPYAAPAVKRQRAEGVAYRNVSGKVWKDAPAKRSSAAKNAIVGSSWEKKMRAKALAKALSEQKAAAVEAAKEKRKTDAARRAAVKARKKANQEKSVQVQRITNSATLKKMMKSKKQRKLLRTADVS